VASARRQAHGRRVDIITNTALTGATYDIDGGQQLVEGA
jgi:hypothetical protein